MIDFVAGETHFLDHLYPIWAALPEDARGHIYLARTHAQGHEAESLLRHALLHDYQGCVPYGDRDALLRELRLRRGLIVTASVNNAHYAARSGRPLVFCEHGAGQTYIGNQASYAGGKHREGVALFLCPNQAVADRNLAAYPRIPAVVVGCPKLDKWHRRKPKARGEAPVIAVGWHWDCRVNEETRWAFPYYRDYLARLSVLGPVLGHGHPRAWDRLGGIYPSLGIEPVQDFEDILRRADVYCCDNSSTLFEFASLNRPVVVVNAPWYRRTHEHGLRFWEAATVGVQVEHPGALNWGVKQALLDPPEQQEARRAGVALAYAYADGHAAERAAAAILALE